MADTRRAAIFIDKGGTGKTTNAAELGAALNELGKRCPPVRSAGKQGDLADALGVYKSVQEDITNEDDFPNIATTMGNRWVTWQRWSEMKRRRSARLQNRLWG